MATAFPRYAPSAVLPQLRRLRQATLDDLASDLRCKGREKRGNSPATFGISLAGAAWQAYEGDFLGGLTAMSCALLAPGGAEKLEAGAYSYIVAAHQRYA